MNKMNGIRYVFLVIGSAICTNLGAFTEDDFVEGKRCGFGDTYTTYAGQKYCGDQLVDEEEPHCKTE